MNRLKLKTRKLHLIHKKTSLEEKSVVDLLYADFQKYLSRNSHTIVILILAALCAYGFELFNFNLTIDEEVHAKYTFPVLEWISQGRWGMYILNKFLLPHTIIPFIPLAIAIAFHISAILLLLESWMVFSQPKKYIIATIGITFPVIAYMYTFSTINYGIGIGLSFIALSLFIYTRKNSALRLYAIIPATFAIGIYQGFITGLISAYLVYLILYWSRFGTLNYKDILYISLIQVFSLIMYLVIQKVALFLSDIEGTSYIFQFIDIDTLFGQLNSTVSRIITTMKMVYFGDKSIYATQIPLLGILVFLLYLGFLAQIILSNLKATHKFLLIISGLVLLFLPFASGLALKGNIAMRFLVAMPIVMMGITTLGFEYNRDEYKLLIGITAGLCIFQFLVSTNYLFGSSHLALQADRLLALRLIEDIESAKATAGNADVSFLETVGYYSIPPTPLMPKAETFGASFFEWDQGNSSRIVLFLQTLGYYGVQTAPLDKRIQMINLSERMPIWPKDGSVKVVDDVILIKFGSYSHTQKSNICNSLDADTKNQFGKFCK